MNSLALSFELAACVAGLLLLIGTPVAYWLAYSHWRGKFLLESIVALPLVLPPTVVGYYALDRKSTHLNSSHSQISYAVFCLKKKKNKQELILLVLSSGNSR